MNSTDAVAAGTLSVVLAARSKPVMLAEIATLEARAQVTKDFFEIGVVGVFAAQVLGARWSSTIQPECWVTGCPRVADCYRRRHGHPFPGPEP